jgi:hypothetical protein
VYLLGLAACWFFFLLKGLLRGQAGMDVWPLLGTLLAYILSLIFGHLGRRILALGIPFTRLVWFISFGLLAYCFGEYAFTSGDSARNWYIGLAALFFVAGLGPFIGMIQNRRARQKRGYDDWTRPQRSLGVLCMEIIALALGVLSAVLCFEWLMA